jgi:hypothetical protein
LAPALLPLSRNTALQVALQFTTFCRLNRLKYTVFCAKRGENLASYTETSAAAAAVGRSAAAAHRTHVHDTTMAMHKYV